MDEALALLRRHVGMKVRKMIEGACCPHGCTVCRIETEEINSPLVAVVHIGANVQLGKVRQSRQGRNSAAADIAHVKWNDSDPALSGESIESQLRRNQGT